MRKIIFFHGADCPHCQRMKPIVEELEKELKLKVEKLEVWYNTKNAAIMRKYSSIITTSCGGDLGVPCFLDVKNKEAICGEMSKVELKKWLMQK